MRIGNHDEMYCNVIVVAVILLSLRQPGHVWFQQGTLKVAHSGSNWRGCFTIFSPAVTMATRASLLERNWMN